MHATEEIIEAAIRTSVDIHRALGPGLLESAYQRILRDELVSLGYAVDVEPSIKVRYKEREYLHSFRPDLLIDRRLVIELKCTEKFAEVHKRQLLTYLRCLEIRNGLLINFGMERAVDGIYRLTNYRVPL